MNGENRKHTINQWWRSLVQRATPAALSLQMMPIAIARDAKALSAANFPEYEVCRCQATMTMQHR